MTPKIMLVDDIDISNFILKKLISKQPVKSEVFDFTDPVKAYHSIKLVEPNLIFLDLNMPVMNGWDFLEKMLKESLHYRVIILTSSTSILDKQRSKNYPNVVDFCEKPLSRERLSQCLATLAGNAIFEDKPATAYSNVHSGR